MENKKIDITSTALEKGIDLVAGFIEKLAGSTLEEAGLMFGDKMKVRRLKNQIKIFSDVQKMAEENNISLKQINLKTLVPLLEFSSLEEDETLQNRWSNLILNFSDASENYESSIFPFILNQLTKIDIEALQALHSDYYIHSGGYIQVGIVKANLIRLGLIEEFRDMRKGELVRNKYCLTDLGISFYECCSSKKDIIKRSPLAPKL